MSDRRITSIYRRPWVYGRGHIRSADGVSVPRNSIIEMVNTLDSERDTIRDALERLVKACDTLPLGGTGALNYPLSNARRVLGEVA